METKQLAPLRTKFSRETFLISFILIKKVKKKNIWNNYTSLFLDWNDVHQYCLIWNRRKEFNTSEQQFWSVVSVAGCICSNWICETLFYRKMKFIDRNIGKIYIYTWAIDKYCNFNFLWNIHKSNIEYENLLSWDNISNRITCTIEHQLKDNMMSFSNLSWYGSGEVHFYIWI